MKKLNFKGRAKQAGFTLIELIVVIVILGIMAATALPKFMDLGADARAAKAQAARAAVMSVMGMAEAAAKAQNSMSATVNVGGTQYTLVGGHPAAADIMVMAGLETDYEDIEETTANPKTAVITTDADHTGCAFTYTEATVNTTATPPTLTTAASIGTAPATSACE